MPSIASASVRAMMAKASSLRARQAASIFFTPSTSGITSLPGMWPQRLGCTWSSMLMPASARLLEHLHGVVDVHRIAVAGIGVGGERDRERAREHAAMVDVLRQSHHADVVDAEQRVRDAGAGGRRHLEARRLDQPRAVTVVDAGGDDQAAACARRSRNFWAPVFVINPSPRRSFLASRGPRQVGRD